MSLAPEFRDRLNQSPQPNLQDVLVVMGSHSLEDSDSDDSEEDEPREPLVHRRGHSNCAFYNTRTSTHSPWFDCTTFKGIWLGANVKSFFVYLFFSSKETFLCFALEKWYQLPSFPNPNKWGYSMVSLNNDVYVTGGSRV